MSITKQHGEIRDEAEAGECGDPPELRQGYERQQRRAQRHVGRNRRQARYVGLNEDEVRHAEACASTTDNTV